MIISFEWKITVIEKIILNLYVWKINSVTKGKKDFLGKKTKIIAKFKIFKLGYLGPGKGFRGPLKGH